MLLIAKLLIVFVAVEHVYILWIEMFAWNTKGRALFKSFPAELFGPTKGMAANQGLYNGFLAAGLLWALLIPDPAWGRHVAVFFLGCVAVAGLYGALTVQKSILFKQALPALVALGAVLLA